GAARLARQLPGTLMCDSLSPLRHIPPLRRGAGVAEQGCLLSRKKGRQINVLLICCPFHFPRSTGSDRGFRALWTPRWTPGKLKLPESDLSVGGSAESEVRPVHGDASA